MARHSIGLILFGLAAALCELTIDLVSTAASLPSSPALQFFGAWPPAKDLTLTNLEIVRVTDDKCTGLTPSPTGKTLIVTNPELCAGEVLDHLLSVFTANTGAILISRDESGDVANLYNWELVGESPVQVPIVLGVPASWGQRLIGLAASELAGASVRLNVAVEQISRDVNIEGSCKYGHANFYNHELTSTADSDSTGPLTISITPTFGDPDLYVNAVTSLEARTVPWRWNAEWTQDSPGDDALTLTLPQDKSVALFSVVCADDSNYTMTLSMEDSLIPLANGFPKRLVVPAGSQRYFVVHVPGDAPLNVSVTPLSGDPDLYISTEVQRPFLYTSQWNSTALAGRYDHVQISKTDPKRCAHVAVCPFYISVKAIDTASTFAIVASWAGQPIRLVAGTPQAGLIPYAGETRRYTTRMQTSNSDLTLTMAFTYGTAHVYVNPTAPAATLAGSAWSSAPLSQNSERIVIRHTEAHFCGGCDYAITVVAVDGAASYTLTATSANTIKVLEDGTPSSEAVTRGSTAFYKLFVPSEKVDIHLALTPFAGDPDMYVSLTVPRPNATSAWKVSEERDGEVIKIRHTEQKFIDCTKDGRTCVVYIGVYAKGTGHDFTLVKENFECSSSDHWYKRYATIHGCAAACAADPACAYFIYGRGSKAGDCYREDTTTAKCPEGFEEDEFDFYKAARGHDSAFSLSATTVAVASGFHVDAPTIVQGDLEFERSLFGTPLPVVPLTGTVKYANPRYACTPLLNPEEYAGAIVLIDRGPADDAACPLPNRYFANKIKRVQEAGAIAAIVANDVAYAGLVVMGAVSGDSASEISIPSVFVSKEDGDKLKRNIGGLRVSLSRPAGRLPMLVQGMPQRGLVGHNEMNYYVIWAPFGKDDLTITLTPSFGNADIFIDTANLPTAYSWKWASQTVGADQLLIRGNDPEATPGGRYYVGVLGASTDSAYTITTSVSATLTTLQSGVPVSNHVAADEYKYFRFWVDDNDDGIVVALTLFSGDADLYVSFTNERPTAEAGQHTWSAIGQTSCVSVDCGNSIRDGDALHIPAFDPRFCGGNMRKGDNCMAYIAVHGSVGAEFSLLLNMIEDEPKVSLVDGEEQPYTLPHAGQYAYFSFYAPPDVKSFDVRVTKLEGDPDLYINSGSHNNGEWPTRSTGWQWRSTSSNDDSVIVSTDSSDVCLPCEYHVSVYAWSDNVRFSISATSTKGHRRVIGGTPAAGSVDGGATRYFRYFVADQTPIVAVLTPFSGAPQLSAFFGAAAPPPAGAAVTLDQIADGIESVRMIPTLAERGGKLYLAVTAPTNATYSLLVTQAAATAGATKFVKLVNGQPQAGILPSYNHYSYYTFAVADMGMGAIFWLTAFSGSPRVYLSPDTTLPGPTHAVNGAGSAAGEPIYVAPSTGNRTFIVAIGSGDASSGGATFSLVGKTGNATQLLQDRAPFRGELGSAEQQSFKVSVPDDAVKAKVTITVLAGEILLSVWADSDTCARQDRSEKCSSLLSSATATPTAPATLLLPAGKRSRVTVAGLAAGSAGRARVNSFTLLAQLGDFDAGASEMLLYDGQPQALELSKDEVGRFSMQSSPRATISVTAAQIGKQNAQIELVGSMSQLVRPLPTSSQEDKGNGRYWAAAEEGDVASLFLSTDLTQSCAINKDGWEKCTTHMAVRANRPCNITIVATAAMTMTMVIGNQVGGALPMRTNGGGFASLSPYTLNLSPTAASDDYVAIDMQVCAGSAILYASLDAGAFRPGHAIPSDLPKGIRRTAFDTHGLQRLELPPDTIMGKRALYLAAGRTSDWKDLASAHEVSGEEAVYEIFARGDRRTSPPRQVAAQQKVSVSYSGGELRVTFKKQKDTGTRTHQYAWYAARLDGGMPRSNLGAWCGVQQSLSVVRASLQGLPSIPTCKYPKADGTCDPAGMRVWPSSQKGGDKLELVAKDTNFTHGVHYSVNVVASYQVDGESFRVIYTPVEWEAGSSGSGGGGGMSGAGVFLLLVLIGTAVSVVIWFFRRFQSGKPIGDVDALRDLWSDTVWLAQTTWTMVCDGAQHAWAWVQPRAQEAWDSMSDKATGQVPRRPVHSRVGDSSSTTSAPMLLDPSTVPLSGGGTVAGQYSGPVGSRSYAGFNDEVTTPMAVFEPAANTPGTDPFATPAEPVYAEPVFTTQPLSAPPPPGSVRADLHDMDD